VTGELNAQRRIAAARSRDGGRPGEIRVVVAEVAAAEELLNHQQTRMKTKLKE